MTKCTSKTQMSDGLGKFVDILNPKPDDVNIEAMFRAMSKINRFGGRGIASVSVLHHSLSMACTASMRGHTGLAKLCLLHDAHETFTGEIPTPMKIAIGRDEVTAIQLGLDAAIFAKAGIDPTAEEIFELKSMDTVAMAAEKKFLNIDPGDDWGFLPEVHPGSIEYRSLLWARTLSSANAILKALDFLEGRRWDE